MRRFDVLDRKLVAVRYSLDRGSVPLQYATSTQTALRVRQGYLK